MIRSAAVVILATALCASGPAAAADEAAKTEPRATMHEVFAALAVLLPASFDDESFTDPAKRAEMLRWLDQLSRASVALERHAEGRDVDFRNLSRSLAADAADLRLRFDLGRTEEARYFVLELTRNCVACHERLPAEREFPFAERLLENVDLDALSVHEQVQLLVTTRQFDRALSAWESLFEDPSFLPAQMDLGGYLTDYLTVSLRVKRDAERPRRALRKLAKRADTPVYLRRHIEGWVRALGELKQDLAGPASVVKARDLVARASRSGEFPADRRRLVYDLVASALLLRYVDQAEPDDPNLAEAFYLLGVTESRSIDTYWVARTEFHFEAAIRLAPKGPFARDAYALLEEYVTFGYGGVFGEDTVPVDVWTNLEELRGMIDEAPVSDAESAPTGTD